MMGTSIMKKLVVNSFHSFTIFAKALHHLFDKVLNTPLHSPKIQVQCLSHHSVMPQKMLEIIQCVRKTYKQTIISYPMISTSTCLQIRSVPGGKKHQFFKTYVLNVWPLPKVLQKPSMALTTGSGSQFRIQESLVQNHWVAPRLTHPFILLKSIK